MVLFNLAEVMENITTVSSALTTHFISHGEKHLSVSDVHNYEDYSCEAIAEGLKREAELRGASRADVMVKGTMVKATDCKAMNVSSHLEKMDVNTRHAFYVMLTNVDRTREVPGMNIESRVCHDLCDEACQIITFGGALGHVFSLPTFLEKLSAWCLGLAVVTVEEVEAAEKAQKLKDKQQEKGSGGDGRLDEEVEIMLEPKANNDDL